MTLARSGPKINESRNRRSSRGACGDARGGGAHNTMNELLRQTEQNIDRIPQPDRPSPVEARERVARYVWRERERAARVRCE